MEHSELKLDAEVRALGFEISEDDFSCRITKLGDPLFWIRLETNTDLVSVTDFIRSSLSEKEMSVALLAVLKAQGLVRVQRIWFKNVTMAADSIDLEYRTVLGHFAKRTGRFLQNLERVDRLGKLDLIAEFST
jgi:hypothetical protein